MAEKGRNKLVLKLLIWLILLGAAGGGVYYYSTRETVIDVTAVRVTRSDVEQTISAISSGTVMPALQSKVTAGMMGKVAQVHVEEGDHAEAGDLLYELEHAELDAQVTLAEANLRVGQSRVEQVRIAADIYDEVSNSRLSLAKAQLDAAQADYDRIKSLADRKAVSQSDFDKVSLAYRVARENLAAAEAGREEMSVRREEVRAAETGIEQLGAALNLAREMREKAFVRAPFPCIVAKKLLEVGEAVAMGLPVAVLLQDGERYIVSPFDEANIREMTIGQRARISLDAYPDETFAGEVSYIAPMVTIVKDLSRTLELKVRILEHPERFVAGMSADVTLIADEKKDVLFAPSESLIRDEFAYVVEEGRAVRREVQLGIGNWERRELLSGLSENDLLITSVNIKALREGAAVRVVDELPD